jgi:REP element-mobilizing transposase RayT
MQTLTPLEPGECYHIYNRGINRMNIFMEERNFAYFMRLYAKHIDPVAVTFAYCLLPNHFHFLVRMRTERRADQPLDRLGFENRVGLDPGLDSYPAPASQSVDRRGFENRVGLGLELDRRTLSQAFGNWLNAYAKAINKAYDRTGSLFQHHFGRTPVTSDRYFTALIHYIHCNPQKHGLVQDFRQWRYSSYPALLSEHPTRLDRQAVLGWFGGLEGFRRFHEQAADASAILELIGED